MAEAKEAYMGLRERKRFQQRADLLLAASSMFRRDGYENTRIEDIAAAANVSPQTVYNYFPTKHAILFGLQEDARERVRQAYKQVADSPPTRIDEALIQLCLAHLGEINGLEDKKLWRELMAAKIRDHDSAGEHFESSRKVYTSYILRTLNIYKQLGSINASVDVKIMADIVFALSFYNFRAFCASDDEDAKTFLNRVRRQVKVLTQDWLSTSIS